jgi:hypothetical protein
VDRTQTTDSSVGQPIFQFGAGNCPQRFIATVYSAISRTTNKFDLVAVLILASTLCFAIGVGASGISAAAILTVLAISYSCLITGQAILNLLSVPLPTSARFAARMLLGTAVISVVILLICLLLRTSAGTAFSLTSIACFGLAVLVATRRNPLVIENEEKPTAFAPIIVSLVCGASVIWSWEAIRSFPRIGKEGVFFGWVDFFFHSSVIAQFAHFSTFNGTSIFSYGGHIPLYHWASYMLPSVVCSFSDTPALVVATTMWVLYGYILMALGACVLGAILADSIGGVAAVVLILFAPSAAHYGFRNPFFDFAWIIQVSPGLSYGIGLCLLTIGLCIVAVQRRSVVALWVAAAVALVEPAFKMHFFVTLVPTCSVLVAMLWQWTRPRLRNFYLAALAAFASLLTLAAEGINRAPHLLSGPHHVSQILRLMLVQEPSAHPNIFPRIMASEPSRIAVPAGILLVLAEAFGILLPAYLLAWAYCHSRGQSRREDCVPLLLVVVYCLVILTFPTKTYTNSLEEYQHRNFVLVYSVLLVWCGYFAARLVTYWWPRNSLFIFAGCACTLLPVPLLFEPITQTNTMNWSKFYATNSVPIGLLQCALYIRKSASPHDIILVSDGDAEGILVSVSERRALLALAPRYDMALDYSSGSIVHRVSVGEQLKNAKTYEEMREIAQSQSIDWYVATPNSPLHGDIPEKVVMYSGGYSVVQFAKYPSDVK